MNAALILMRTMAPALAVLALSGLGSIEVAQAQTFTTLHRFGGPVDGAVPEAGLAQATDGQLYGTTYYGGPYGYGTAFKITTGGKLVTLHNFCSPANCADGASPQAGLVLATNGRLYGTAFTGAPPSGGTIFEIASSGTLTTIHQFCSVLSTNGNCTDGAYSVAGLIQGADGDFYGTTEFGGAYGYGNVFKVTSSGTLVTLYSFCSQSNCTDGTEPQGGLVQSTDGNFYGTTSGGGAFDGGTVFQITPSGVLTVLANFNGLDGTEPLGALIQANDGNLYGTTYYGGTYGYGTVFKVTTSGLTTVVHHFFGNGDGANPAGGIIQATDGQFYGTTKNGGAYGYGTVFMITGIGTELTLHHFDETDGAYPLAGLVQCTDGNFYGTTSDARTSRNVKYGTVFSLSMGLAPFGKLGTIAGPYGAIVHILGSDMTGATHVTFNGTEATFRVVSASEITTKVPTGATTGIVQVVTPSGALSSNVAYTVEPKTATPKFSLKGGTYTGAQTVAISDATAAAVIYYTLDGTVPTPYSPVYEGPLVIRVTETLKAVAVGPDDILSAVKTATYTIQ